MKPHISIEFLRGLLFSYVAYHLYTLFAGLFVSLPPLQVEHWIGIGIILVLIVIYGAIGYALLFTPKGYARFVTVFLVVLLLIQLFTILFLGHDRPTGLHSPSNTALVSQVVVGILFIGLAYVHQRFLKSRSRNENSRDLLEQSKPR